MNGFVFKLDIQNASYLKVKFFNKKKKKNKEGGMAFLCFLVGQLVSTQQVFVKII